VNLDTARHLKNLTTAASAYAVTLPEPVVEIRDAEHDLPNLAEVQADTVAEISSALGSKTYAKTVETALDRLVRAEAAHRLTTPLADALLAARWQAVAEHSGEIVALFRDAIGDDLDALNTHARRVPPTATATSTDLSTDAYAARFNASQADARLRVVTQALAPFYGLALAGTGNLSAIHVRRMMLADVPADLLRETAQAVAIGFGDGRFVGLSRSQTPALWFAVLAHLGVTFRLLDPAEHAETVARMRDAVRQPRVGETLPEVV
jgi:hypothetical protein